MRLVLNSPLVRTSAMTEAISPLQLFDGARIDAVFVSERQVVEQVFEV